MKRILTAVLASAMLVTSLAACGGGNSASSAAPASSTAPASQTSGSEPAGEAAQIDAPAVTIDVGFGPTIDMPYGIAHEYWAKTISERSGGNMTMNVFPSDQLGSTKDTIDQCLTGDAVVTSTHVSYFADLGVKDLMIIQAPYLCETWEQMDKIFASDWFKEQEALLEEKGIKVLAANWRYGDRHTITKNKVEHPADIKGMKIRVPQATAFVKGFEAIGASPTPMALGDVYTALQQGAIDGLENPLPTIYGNKYQEVAKYLLLDAHMKTINIQVCGIDFFNTLSPEQQALLVETAVDAGEYQNELAAAKDAELLAAFEAEGCTITEIDYNEWKEAAKSFYDMPEFADWTPGLYDRIQEIMNA